MNPWWLKWVNYLAQVFFVRLTRNTERIITKFSMISWSPFNGLSGYSQESKIYQWYSVQYWIIPFTGWSNEFKYSSNQKLFRITKKKLLK